MAKTITNAPRKNMFVERPEDLTLITDPEHPLYDERVNLPLKEPIVLNIMHLGVMEPVLVRKVGDEKQVVAGRQRVRHAIEANRRLRDMGGTEKRVPVIYQNGDDRKMRAIIIAENEVRQDTDPLEKANRAQSLIDDGYTEEEVAAIYAVTSQTIRNWQTLLNLTGDVQSAVAAGEIKPTAAIQLAHLPAPEQKATLEQLKTEGGKVTVKRAARAAQGERTAPVKRMRNRAKVEECLAGNVRDDEYGQGFSAALRWVLCIEEEEQEQEEPK